MAQVTSPIILDSTGQQIHSDLQQIKNALTTPSAAADITFDNTGTGMQADDVQDAITELKSNLTDNKTWKLIKDDISNTDTPITIPSNYTELMMTCRHSTGYVFSQVLPIDSFSANGTTLMVDGYYLSSTNYMLINLSVTNKTTAKRFHQSNGSGVSGTWENPSLWGR